MSGGRLRDPRDTRRLAEAIDRSREVRETHVVGMVDVPTLPEPGRPDPADDVAPQTLAGITVLVPRSRDRAEVLRTLLEARGARVLVSPAISRARVEDVTPVDDAVRALARGEHALVAVTSVNAVDELAAAARRQDVDLAGVATRWVAVGPATARELEGRGIPVALVPAESSARGLLAELPAPETAGERVLLPLGNLATPTLADGLRAAGYDPHVVTVYRTVAHPLDAEVQSAWLDGGVDVVVLTSGSVAREVARQLGPHGTVAGVAIGRPTQRAAVESGLRVDAVAGSADDPGLLAAVEHVVAQMPGRETPPEAAAAPPAASAARPAPAPAPAPDRGGLPVTTPRPRRLRTTPAMRRLVAETRLHPADLVLPLFVREGITEPVPISSMPGQVQHTEATLAEAVRAACAAGLGGVMLFGVPARRDATGTAGDDPEGVLNRGVRIARQVSDESVAAGGAGVVVMADTCLDEFTDHGHCGVLDDRGRVDNDATLTRYAALAVAQAMAGADVVAPSGMMDGQVAVIREALDAAGFADVTILAYSAKYASAYYGPFREAVDSALQGDRRTYQMDASNYREGMREADLDLDEGADMVMVKPAGSYLDVLAGVAERSDVPVAAYQVSGEYAMIEAAAANGWIDRRAAVLESVLGIRRAGADVVLTYWALEIAGWLDEKGTK